MTADERAGLEAVARAASTITSLAAVIGGDRWRLDGWPDEVVEFIATFDPPTVLGLLEALERAEAKVAAVEALADEWEASGCIHLNTLWSRLRAALATEDTVETGRHAHGNGPVSDPGHESDQRGGA